MINYDKYKEYSIKVLKAMIDNIEKDKNKNEDLSAYQINYQDEQGDRVILRLDYTTKEMREDIVKELEK